MWHKFLYSKIETEKNFFLSYLSGEWLWQTQVDFLQNAKSKKKQVCYNYIHHHHQNLNFFSLGGIFVSKMLLWRSWMNENVIYTWYIDINLCCCCCRCCCCCCCNNNDDDNIRPYFVCLSAGMVCIIMSDFYQSVYK